MLKLGNHDVYIDIETSLSAAWIIRHWRWLKAIILFLYYPWGLTHLCQPYHLPQPLLTWPVFLTNPHSQFSKLAPSSHPYWSFSLKHSLLPVDLSPIHMYLLCKLFKPEKFILFKPCRLQGKIPSCRNRPTRTFSKLQSVSKSTWAMCPVSKGPLRWSWRRGTRSTVTRKTGLKEED